MSMDELNITLTEETRQKLGEKGCAWYDSLTEENHKELQEAYVDKVTSHKGMESVSYERFILTVAKLAVHFKGDEKKIDKTLARTQKVVGMLGKKGML